MSYLVLARKYRPLVFEDILAQGHVSRTLVNAIAGGRISHAYLFAGPRGVGKTSTARILARAVNCTQPVGQDPCNVCDTCREILQGNSLDVLEIDGASNRGIDEIRDLRERVGYSPTHCRYKIYIIDEVHMLTQEAFNALLKTLEEPPSHVIFIFATTAPHKVPPTILSRCQRFDFKAVPPAAIQAHLAGVLEREGIRMPEEVLEMVARKAGGAMRDALSLLDQVIAFCGGDYTVQRASQVLGVFDSGLFLDLTDLVAARQPLEVLRYVERLVDSGVDLEEFYQELAGHYRNLIALRLDDSGAASEIPAAWRQRYAELAGRFELEDLVRSLHLVLGYEETFRRSSQQKICLDLVLVRLALLESSVDIGRLINQLGAGDSPAGQVAAPEIRSVRDSGSGGSAGRSRPASPARESSAPTAGAAPHGRAHEARAPEETRNESAIATAPGDSPEAAPEAESRPLEVEAGPLDLEKLKNHWPRIIESIKQKRISLAPVLGALSPSRFDDHTLVVNISRSLGYYCERLRAPECKRLVTGTICELFGLKSLELEIVTVEDAPGAEPVELSAEKNPGSRSFEQLCRTDPVMGKINALFDPELI